ncbi:hypothetical protein [Streptomyces sp. NPDC053431]|uniref:hypothetical protein n=1 Tax=Streptomyces sp. NPDC053431 TaxID=3365703 RepID=UPI0037D06752
MNVSKMRKLAVAAAAAALVPVGAGADSAAADIPVSPVAYKVEVSFEKIRFENIDDCAVGTCSQAEIFGYLKAETTDGYYPWSGGKGFLNFGGWDEASASPWVSSWATASGLQKRFVYNDVNYKFADTRLCSSSGWSYCVSGYSKSNNRVLLATVKPGSTLNVKVKVDDYDFDSESEEVCAVTKSSGQLTANDLKNLDLTLEGGYTGSEAKCGVTIRLRTVGYDWGQQL